MDSPSRSQIKEELSDHSSPIPVYKKQIYDPIKEITPVKREIIEEQDDDELTQANDEPLNLEISNNQLGITTPLQEDVEERESEDIRSEE